MTTETRAWMDEHGVRTCPQCGTTFDGSHIGATPQARILCSDCTAKRVEAAGKKRRPGR